MRTQPFRLDRRQLLACGVSAVAIGFGATLAAAEVEAPSAAQAAIAARQRAAPPLPRSAFVFVGADDRVHLILPVTEMGQGVATGFAALVARELGFANPGDIRVQPAPLSTVYASPGSGLQATAASTSTMLWHGVVTAAVRALRAGILDAAALQFGVAAAALTLEPTRVLASGRAPLPLGALTLPETQIAGRAPTTPPAAEMLASMDTRNVSAPQIVAGAFEFGIDVAVPGQLFAAVRCCPTYPATALLGYDAAAARAVRGVREIVELENGIAILADRWWPAKRAIDLAAPRWAPAPKPAEVFGELRRALRDGEATSAITSPPVTTGVSFSQDYGVPYLAHAALEPLSCTARVAQNDCELWLGTQSPFLVARDVARALDMPIDRVVIHNFPMGGSFGRRVIGNEVAVQAACLARRAGVPVKLVWDREEDMRHDRYRAATVAELSARVDAKGRPLRLAGRVACDDWTQNLGASSPRVRTLTQTSGLLENPYAFPALDISYVESRLSLPVGPWRSIAHGANVFFLETFVDELADRVRADPIDYRRSLLAADSPGHRVLEVVRVRSGWDSRRAQRRVAFGVSLQFAWQTWIATVARVEDKDGERRVTDLWAAVDCGIAVNPLGVRKQIEGGLLFGVSAALFGRIDVGTGGVAQSNFHDYRVLRIHEAPRVDVTLVPAARRVLGGVGEAGTSAAMPAVANAWSKSAGRRARTLPLLG